MKDIFSLLFCQTLLFLFLKHITMCHAVDLSDSDNYSRSNYEESNSNSRRRYYGDSDNVSRANQYYEKAYTDGDGHTNQQDYLTRTGTDTKFTKPANQRKPLYSESRKAYAAALRYSNTRNGDSSEIDSAMAGASSAEIGDSNGSIMHEDDHANNSEFGSVSTIVKSNFPKQSQSSGKTDSCTCQGAANEEVSFLCFSSKDGKTMSIKYKGTKTFDIEDIMKGYKFYFDSMQAHNANIETIVNSESNFMNEGNFNFNAESKFDINKMKKGDSKFKVTFDVNTIKEDSNKFSVDNKDGGLDIQKYLNDNNNFKTQFEKNINSNSKMEAWKKILQMAESKTKNKFSFNKNSNGNQFSYEGNVQADAQSDIEAHAKALAEFKAKAKAQAIFQAQIEAKSQAILQNQILAQAKFDAEAKARAKAKAEAEAQMQINSQSQSHTISFSDVNQGHLNNFVGGEKKLFGNGGFSMGFNGGIGASNFGSYTKQTGFSYGGGTGGAFSYGGGAGGAIGIGGGAGGAIGIGGGAGGAIGIGGGAGGAIGIGGGAGGAVGIGGGAGGAIGVGGGAGGAIGIGGGAGGAIGIGGVVPFSAKSMLGGNEGQSMGSVITYSGNEFNYGDDLYDESLDDGSLSTGYSGVLAFPASSDGRLYNNGRLQKDGYPTFGASGYRYH